MRQLVQLQERADALNKLGYQILGISPDAPEGLRGAAAKTGVTFALLSDPGLKTARAFGVAFGPEGGGLPVPAVFVLDTEGKIHFQYVNPNYQVRLHPEVLETAARVALGGK